MEGTGVGGGGGAPATCVFPRQRMVGKGLDGELLLLRSLRARNVVKQTPSSLRARPFPPARCRLKAEFRRHTTVPSFSLPSQNFCKLYFDLCNLYFTFVVADFTNIDYEPQSLPSSTFVPAHRLGAADCLPHPVWNRAVIIQRTETYPAVLQPVRYVGHLPGGSVRGPVRGPF